jgi:TldD protein
MNDRNADRRLDAAESLLLRPNDLDAARLEPIFGLLAGHQLDDADLYFQYSRSEAWSLEEGQVKSGSFNIDQGVGVRAVTGDKTAFAYSDDISLAAIRQAAGTVRAIAGAGQSGVARRLTRAAGRDLYCPIDPLGSLDEAAKVALLHRLEAYARGLDPRVSQVMASLAGEYEVVYIARLDGRVAADVRPLARVSLQVIVEQDGRREQGSAGGGGRFDYAYFSDAVLKDYAEQAVHQVLTNLDAKPAPAGAMTVVLGSGWPGILLHEAIGHGLEGDFNRKGSSAFSGRIGERVAAPGVTVVDDGTLADRRGSLNVDDEGTPTQCTTLIEEDRKSVV